MLFTNSSCLVQDHLKKTPLLLDNNKNGLYYFEDTCNLATAIIPPTNSLLPIATVVTCNKTLDEAKLWHLRLGHVPFTTLKAYKHDLDTHTLLNSLICTICPKAKQSRQPFSSSYVKSTSPFELLHMDIWAPYSVCTSNGCKFFLTIVDDYT